MQIALDILVFCCAKMVIHSINALDVNFTGSVKMIFIASVSMNPCNLQLAKLQEFSIKRNGIVKTTER